MLSAWFRSRAAMPCWLTISFLLILAILITTARTAAVQPGTERFQRTWNRTDQPVLDGLVPRTWMWGPEASFAPMQEPYSEAPGGQRTVQYFDKARMEDNSYRADGPPWDVTNGLLVVEMISGNMQSGDAAFEPRSPALVNVAGDADDPSGPTYTTFGALLDAPARGLGTTITARVDRAANVADDAALASNNVTVGFIDDVTAHAIATPFWEFMNATGTVYEDGQYSTDFLFENPYFATGRPITEAYWAEVKVAGTYRDVLMQCFERRCLTYTPGNPEGFVIEAGNVGQHYFAWRYDGQEPPPTLTPDPGATAQPSATPSATGEPTATAEPTASQEPSPTPALHYAHDGQWGETFDAETLMTGPNGVAISASGRVYVVNTPTNTIMIFSLNGYYLGSWGGLGSEGGDLDGPHDVAVDPDGNVYVADTNNHRIQKFDADGNFLLQWGTRGSQVEQFEAPQGIAVMNSGPDYQVYVADTGNDRVQAFKTDGEFVRSWGKFGTGDGDFNLPAAIAINQETTHVYVADAFNNRIQKFDSTGSFLAKWGVKGVSDGELDTPQGVAVDSSGNVYVADYKNDRVQKFSENGTFIIKWGTPGIARGEFKGPSGLAVDGADVVYVVEFDGGQLQKFGGDGTYVDRWYDGFRGTLTTGSFGLALDSNGNTYITDTSHDCVQKFDADGAWLLDIGELCFGAGDLINPVAAVASPDGYLYVVSIDNGKVIKYTQDGAFVTEWGRDGTGNGEFDVATGLALDVEGNVYVVDRNNNRIQKFTANGLYITQWGTLGNGNGQFNHPYDIAIFGERVYVVDEDNERVQEFDRDGNYIRQWGSFGSGEGQFQRPAGIAVDAYGYVYVTDIGPGGMAANLDARVQKFTPDGGFLTQFGTFGSIDGELNLPYRVEVNAAGTVYVLDSGNFKVHKFSPVTNGIVPTMVAG